MYSLTRPALCAPFAPNALAPARTSFLQHVIASQCAHWRGNPFSPQRNLARWQQFGRIRDALRIRLRRSSPLCAAAGEADCHVASLLAMTCKNLPPVRTIPGHCRCTAGKRPCTRRHVSAFCMSLRPTFLHLLTRLCLLHVIANHPLQPLTRHRLLHVIANQCAHWCGNPRPRSNTWQACRT